MFFTEIPGYHKFTPMQQHVYMQKYRSGALEYTVQNNGDLEYIAQKNGDLVHIVQSDQRGV